MTSGHTHDDRDARPGDGLAQAVRSAHAASLDHLSPRVRAQLAQRRRAALAEHGGSSAPRRWPMFALGSAAALTLAIGLLALRDGSDAVAPSPGEVAVTPAETAPTPTPAEPATAPAPAVAATDTGADMSDPAVDSIVIDDASPVDLLAAEFSGGDDALGFDALQESPDFYLWLGSDSAQPQSSEVL